MAVERSKNTNINPLMNAIGAGVTGKARLVSALEKENKPVQQQQQQVAPQISGFDAFADANLFTMKSMDAYVDFSLLPPMF